MSSPSITDLDGPAFGDRSPLAAVASPVRRIAFWIAVVLPFLYIPLLSTGLSSRNTMVVFGLLVTCNVAALLVGHRHGHE